MARSATRRLLVEGSKDQRVLPYLLESNGVAWPKGNEPVDVKSIGGKTLTADEIEAEFSAPGLQVLGLMLDADESAASTWQRVRGWFEDRFPDMPTTIPPAGFISLPNAKGIKLGVWIMPDNAASGMLETFLKYLVPEAHDAVLHHAVESRDTAKRDFNAPFKIAHADKALIHTWLAWQDEPGLQLHDAVKFKILSPNATSSKPFVAWFRLLFQV